MVVVVELIAVKDTPFRSSGMDGKGKFSSSRKDQVASSARAKYRGEQQINAAHKYRGDNVIFVLPPDDDKGNFVLHEALLLPEDDFILPPNIPDDTGQVHVRPPDECAKNYVSRGGSPHGIYGAFDVGNKSTDRHAEY